MFEKSTNLIILKHSLGDHIGGPAEALEKFLISAQKTFKVIAHPINRESRLQSVIKEYKQGGTEAIFVTRRKHFGILSYFLDLRSTPSITDGATVICFNPWAVIIAKIKAKGKGSIIFWGVDYIPEQQHFNPRLSLYKKVEQLAFRFVDFQIENNEFALRERRRRISVLTKNKIPHLVVTISHNFNHKLSIETSKQLIRILYVGGLNPRNGGTYLVEIAKELQKQGASFRMDVIGGGISFEEIKSLLDKHQLEEKVVLHGQVDDDLIPKIAREADFGLAPYQFGNSLFTTFADPGKLVFYAAFGLATLVSRVPLMVVEYEQHASFFGMSEDSTPEDWATKLIQLHSDQNLLRKLRMKSKEYGQTRETEVVFNRLITHPTLAHYFK